MGHRGFTCQGGLRHGGRRHLEFDHADADGRAQGGTLTGKQSGDGSTTDIFDGTVSGNDVSWKISITNPMPLTLQFTGAVDGDKMSGKMSAGALGSWPFSGVRA